MRMRVIGRSRPADFDAWVANQHQPAANATDPEAAAGEAIFKSQCARCHTIAGRTDHQGQPIVSQANEQVGRAPRRTSPT